MRRSTQLRDGLFDFGALDDCEETVADSPCARSGDVKGMFPAIDACFDTSIFESSVAAVKLRQSACIDADSAVYPREYDHDAGDVVRKEESVAEPLSSSTVVGHATILPNAASTGLEASGVGARGLDERSLASSMVCDMSVAEGISLGGIFDSPPAALVFERMPPHADGTDANRVMFDDVEMGVDAIASTASTVMTDLLLSTVTDAGGSSYLQGLAAVDHNVRSAVDKMVAGHCKTAPANLGGGAVNEAMVPRRPVVIASNASTDGSPSIGAEMGPGSEDVTPARLADVAACAQSVQGASASAHTLGAVSAGTRSQNQTKVSSTVEYNGAVTMDFASARFISGAVAVPTSVDPPANSVPPQEVSGIATPASGGDVATTLEALGDASATAASAISTGQGTSLCIDSEASVDWRAPKGDMVETLRACTPPGNCGRAVGDGSKSVSRDVTGCTCKAERSGSAAINGSDADSVGASSGGEHKATRGSGVVDSLVGASSRTVAAQLERKSASSGDAGKAKLSSTPVHGTTGTDKISPASVLSTSIEDIPESVVRVEDWPADDIYYACKAPAEPFASYRIHHIVEPVVMPDRIVSAVRSTRKHGNNAWKLVKRNYDVRPPEVLINGVWNPLRHLGECGDLSCPNCRLHETNARIRPTFVDFCEKHIMQICPADDDYGIIYSTLGCGDLYFDWEVLDRIIHETKVNVREVWLIDTKYSSVAPSDAEMAFASWFHDTEVIVRSFHDTSTLKVWLSSSPDCRELAADVLVQCDAMDTNGEMSIGFSRIALRPGGLNLQLRHPSERVARLWTPGKEAHFDDVERDRWDGSEWVAARARRNTKPYNTEMPEAVDPPPPAFAMHTAAEISEVVHPPPPAPGGFLGRGRVPRRREYHTHGAYDPHEKYHVLRRAYGVALHPTVFLTLSVLRRANGIILRIKMMLLRMPVSL